MTDMTTSRELREVRRQQALERRAMKAQRQRVVERIDEARNKRGLEAINRHNALVVGLIPRISGAIDSWAGKRVPLSVKHPARQFRAITDFQSIAIDLPNVDVDVDFAADLRGVAYHEAGHILVTVPFPDLVNHALPTDDENTVRRDRWVSKATGRNLNQLHHAWNVLEDQRMESAMVRESKNLGRYYNVLVLTHVLQRGVTPTCHLLLHGREHVDANVRAAARLAFMVVNGSDTVADVDRIIVAYKRSKDLHEMWALVVQFAQILTKLQAEDSTDSVDTHEDPEKPLTEKEREERTEQGAEPSDFQGQGEEQEEGQGAEGDSSDNATPDENNEGGGADSTSQDSEDSEGGGDGSSSSDSPAEWNEETVREALKAAKEARNNDRQITNDLKAYNQALKNTGKGLPIPRIPTTIDPDPEARTTAVKINQALRRLMEQARAENAPSWQTQQRRGILDVNRYVTRQRGDMEFYKQYAAGGDLHLPNMAVSVVLDGSGSMDGYAQDLAIAAFGMKSACDVVGVPCTVTVYDHNAYLLWDEHDRPLEVPFDIVPGGSTDPKRALDLLDLQKDGKDHHLVIIMTDGMWDGNWRGRYSLADYAAPQRDIVLFFYQMPTSYGPKGMETCSLVQTINDLGELPRFLTRYIARAM